LRYNNWKLKFLSQNATGLKVWSQPFVELRMPMIENLRMDPFERAADEGMGYQPPGRSVPRRRPYRRCRW
jgi:hypothetical protein